MAEEDKELSIGAKEAEMEEGDWLQPHQSGRRCSLKSSKVRQSFIKGGEL